MNEWQVVLLIGSIITFFVGTMIPIVRPLIKLNNVMQKNTDAIDALTEKIDDLTLRNKEEHDHFFNKINALQIDVEVLKNQHERER